MRQDPGRREWECTRVLLWHLTCSVGLDVVHALLAGGTAWTEVERPNSLVVKMRRQFDNSDCQCNTAKYQKKHDEHQDMRSNQRRTVTSHTSVLHNKTDNNNNFQQHQNYTQKNCDTPSHESCSRRARVV